MSRAGLEEALQDQVTVRIDFRFAQQLRLEEHDWRNIDSAATHVLKNFRQPRRRIRFPKNRRSKVAENGIVSRQVGIVVGAESGFDHNRQSIVVRDNKPWCVGLWRSTAAEKKDDGAAQDQTLYHRLAMQDWAWPPQDKEERPELLDIQE